MFQNMFNLLLQFALFTLATAAPLVAENNHGHNNNNWQWGTGGGIIGFIILILDIIVWLEVLKSNRPVPNKVLWCLLVFIFPLGGMIIYYLFSNRAAHKTGYETIAA